MHNNVHLYYYSALAIHLQCGNTHWYDFDEIDWCRTSSSGYQYHSCHVWKFCTTDIIVHIYDHASTTPCFYHAHKLSLMVETIEIH